MREISLGAGTVALVDEADYDRLNHFSWHRNVRRKNCIYAQRQVIVDGHRSVVQMHREIIGAMKGDIVDHINGNTLDNRRSNLRLVSYRENAFNRRPRKDSILGVRGVRQRDSGKFSAYIFDGKKRIQLGEYLSLEEAVSARHNAARKLHGEFFTERKA